MPASPPLPPAREQQHIEPDDAEPGGEERDRLRRPQRRREDRDPDRPTPEFAHIPRERGVDQQRGHDGYQNDHHAPAPRYREGGRRLGVWRLDGFDQPGLLRRIASLAIAHAIRGAAQANR